VGADTPKVVAAKVAVVAASATVTLAGTVASTVSVENNDTTRPPTGAAPFSVTVPVEAFPPSTGEGEKDTA
jgi:hypothetical protein